MSNLYVHIPFCARKCRYCAFYSVTPAHGAVEEYIKALMVEMVLRRGEVTSPPETIYFGGGTPSLLAPDEFRNIADALRANWSLDSVKEWTVELNPASTTKDFLRALRETGVNRISLGIQSFCDTTLERIGRLHNAETAIRAVQMAQDEGFDDVGFDLIANLPGVSEIEWGQTLKTALSLSPKHISVYDLIVEPETEFGRSGANLRPGFSDDAAMDVIKDTSDLLDKSGFARYEISNYALRGFECKHNLAVWRGEDYVGFGPAASSRVGLQRRTNAWDIDGYCSSLHAGKLSPPSDFNTVSPEDDVEERFVFGLRLKEGVSPKRFAQAHPIAAPLANFWEQKLASFAVSGISEPLPGGFWRLTPRGLEVCDSVIEELLR